MPQPTNGSPALLNHPTTDLLESLACVSIATEDSYLLDKLEPRTSSQ